MYPNKVALLLDIFDKNSNKMFIKFSKGKGTLETVVIDYHKC